MIGQNNQKNHRYLQPVFFRNSFVLIKTIKRIYQIIFFSFLLKSFRRIFFFSWHFCGKFGKSRMKSRGNEIHSNEWAWVRAPTHSTYMANGVRFVSLLCCVSHWRLWVILWWLIVDSRQLKRHRCALPNKSSEIEMFESRLLVIQCAMKSKRKAYAPIKRIFFFFSFLYL